MRRAPRAGLLAGLPAAFLVAGLAGGADRPSPPDARQLFLTHCATCHGETGDGKGVTQLDRPARSFQDGGFSFGNTPEALFRTITSGIPGSPMPAFEAALSEDERRLLADYVRSLGPPATEVDERDALLQVTDRPLVVRGHLPPIAGSTPERPRGLLIGMPSGLTFQWRTDDVRLLGLRMGDFVDRKDWSGRGGTPIQPLGRVVHLLGGGDPDAPWRMEAGKQALSDGSVRVLTEPLEARFAGTFVRGEDAGVRYRLVDDEGSVLATVEDDLRALGTSVGAGYRRRVSLGSGAGAATVYATLANPRGERVGGFRSESAEGAIEWEVRRLGESLYECAGMHLTAGEDPVVTWAAGPLAKLELGEDRRARILTSVVLTAEWNEDVQEALSNEVRP